VGGLPEVVAHGKTGYLAPVGDVDAMAEYAIGLLQNPIAYREFSQAAHERAARLFDYHLLVDRYEGIYDRVLGI